MIERAAADSATYVLRLLIDTTALPHAAMLMPLPLEARAMLPPLRLRRVTRCRR